tara:strand:- start:2435 stop:2866 length:432 start_codon:yes stop_codon:yes gene_type:complete
MNDTQFIHVTAEGTILQADEMETSHVFNCIKMWYNHLAVLVGFQEIWFRKKKAHIFHTWQTDPQKGMDILKGYMLEFESRDNIEDRHLEKYCLIRNFLTGKVHSKIMEEMEKRNIKYEFPENKILKLLNKRRENEQQQLTNGS